MPRRRGQQPLTRERIVTAALALIDEAGLDALSMRRLGRELGVDPMAVYHHVPNKDELMREVVRKVFAELRVPRREGTWQERVREWANTYRAVALAHPNLVLRILSDVAAVAVAAAAVNESLYAALEDSGLAPLDAVRGADVIVDFVHGVVLAESSAATDDEDAIAAFHAALDELPPEDVAVQRRLLEAAGDRPSDGFTFGLDVILAGLEATRTKPMA
jgi:TetR/AcrR family tetracycline transcriptional repressor